MSATLAIFKKFFSDKFLLETKSFYDVLFKLLDAFTLYCTLVCFVFVTVLPN